MAIRNCWDKATSDFLAGNRVRDFEACASGAIKALTRLQAVVQLDDLRRPPSTRFEPLGGDRKGEYSIRINRQWRVCFRWALEDLPPGADTGTAVGEPYDVEINNHYG
jgi:toxin HigB-1